MRIPLRSKSQIMVTEIFFFKPRKEPTTTSFKSLFDPTLARAMFFVDLLWRLMNEKVVPLHNVLVFVLMLYNLQEVYKDSSKLIRTRGRGLFLEGENDAELPGGPPPNWSD